MDDPNEPLVSIPLTVDEWAVAYSVIHTMVSMASQGPVQGLGDDKMARFAVEGSRLLRKIDEAMKESS